MPPTVGALARRYARRGPASAALAVAVAVLSPGAGWAQGAAPPAPDPVADAYLAAWNAHDLPGVLARFAPDAVVRERHGEVPPDVWDTRDPQVARAYLEGTRSSKDFASEGYNRSGLSWATGHPEIAAWAAARFGFNHRDAAGPRRATGATAGWTYREFADPYQLLPGVGPVAGDAVAEVRDGRITRLTLVLSPLSVARQREEVAVVAARVRAAAPRATPAENEASSAPPRGSDGSAPPEPTSAAWPLALAGLAIAAATARTLHRQRRP